MKRVVIYQVVSVLAMLATISFAQAITSVTVNVTVILPPCVINDDHPIEVEFGEVMTTRVDGVNYRMPIDYTLDCGDASTNSLKLQVQGNSASFDSSVLQTSVEGLGIRIQNGTTTLPMNEGLNFVYPEKPVLWVVPVKKVGTTLPAGEFTAVSTMKVDYQ